ncbi:MAG TPA: hypothetical protein P5270_01605 [Victivallales bacterium]|nr:hypothetical protein [Victivallales bacterium]HPO91227.1 hypothetical protein [Victivallales bacterium]HRR28034.1 hypothetical protein [Victivallales bacterium]HRU00496.1 hypothetical protein [Victivallales bacterium]
MLPGGNLNYTGIFLDFASLHYPDEKYRFTLNFSVELIIYTITELVKIISEQMKIYVNL